LAADAAQLACKLLAARCHTLHAACA
jgi:hypothetical protein